MDAPGLQHETQVHGTMMAWREIGHGPALVLLHGIQDSHRSWRRAAPLLADRFRVLMPDLPGHGWSGRPNAPYTLPWFARMVASWMDTLGLDHAHVCGHSYGGGVALWMLLQQRSRLDRLALVATGGLGREVSIWMRLAAVPVLGPALAPPLMRLGTPWVLRMFPGLVGNMEPEEARRVARMTRLPGTDRAFVRTLSGVVDVRGQHQQMLPRASQVPAPPPMALYWGLQDPVIPVKHAWKLLQHSTGITLNTYGRCGHYPQLEMPGPFAADLQAFLLDPARPSARLSPTPLTPPPTAALQCPLGLVATEAVSLRARICSLSCLAASA